MDKLRIIFNKKEKKFEITANGSDVLLNIKSIPVKSALLTNDAFNFMLVARILSRCGFVKPLKRI